MRLIAAAIAAALALAAIVPAIAEDIPGSSDHPLVGRYEGSRIDFHEVKEYNEVQLPSGPLERGMSEDLDAWQTALAGKHTSIRYVGPGDRTALEILRNYEQSLAGNGFEITFFCRGGDACAPGGASTFWDTGRGGIGLPTNWDTTTYLLARRADGAGTTSVGILAVETRARGSEPLRSTIAVTVVEAKAVETDRIAVVAADELEQTLTRDGKIAIYGIEFDFDSAELRAGSAPQIEQLAALLNENPELRIIVVGHTDGQGTFEYNLTLSQQRAQAVVDALAAEYAIDAARMTPAGAGMISPVATNRTEEGRARNRRVEIVEVYAGP